MGPERPAAGQEDTEHLPMTIRARQSVYLFLDISLQCGPVNSDVLDVRHCPASSRMDAEAARGILGHGHPARVLRRHVHGVLLSDQMICLERQVLEDVARDPFLQLQHGQLAPQTPLHIAVENGRQRICRDDLVERWCVQVLAHLRRGIEVGDEEHHSASPGLLQQPAALSDGRTGAHHIVKDDRVPARDALQRAR